MHYFNIPAFEISKLSYAILSIYPINAHSSQNVDEILEGNAWIRNYLNESCLSKHYHQLSFKYLVKSFKIPKVIAKSMIDLDDNFSWKS